MTIKCANKCANVTAYYLNNLPLSVILGLNAMRRMDVWVRTSAQAGEGIKLCTSARRWITAENFGMVHY